MKANVFQTRSVVLTCVLAFGILQHAAWAADERQTLQALSKSFTVLAQEVGEVVVGIETEQSDRDKDWKPRFDYRDKSEGWEPFGPELRRWFRQNSDRDGKSEYYFFDPDPYREKRERGHHAIPESMVPYHSPEELERLSKAIHHLQNTLPDHSPKDTNFGSGILLDEEGHIATIMELVDDSEEIIITLQDGIRLDAEMVASDEGTGIAVLKVDTDELPTAKFGDSTDIAIGELLVTLGHTADQEPAVSLGMISGVGRNPRIVDYENWFAIDTNLRPGSGGGAIVSAKGEIIGMTAGGSSNNAFAIPINTVRQVATELIEHGKVVRGWLGVSIQEVDSDLAEKLGLDKPMGAMITHILDGTPAAEFDLRKGDVIVAINDEAIKNVNHLRAIVAMYKPATTVSISILRKGQTQDISVTLSERSARVVQHSKDSEGYMDLWKGLSVQNLTVDLAEKLGHTSDKGVLIAGVAPGSVAAKAGLRKGDLILEVENQPIHSVAEFKSAVEKVEGEAKILLLVKHEGQARYVTVK